MLIVCRWLPKEKMGDDRRMAKILIIDDEPQIVQLLEAALIGQGHSIFTSSGGEDGAGLAKSQLPALIITDMNMPGGTGWDLIRTLRADEATKDIPIIALTAHQTDGDRDEAYQSGCDAYITKPIDLDKFLARAIEFVGQP